MYYMCVYVCLCLCVCVYACVCLRKKILLEHIYSIQFDFLIFEKSGTVGPIDQ